jgi:phage terminase large subunit GpA-like protein
MRSAASARSMRSASTSGYRSHIVYAWVRKHQRVHPLSGHDAPGNQGPQGWGRPAIGQPKLVDINLGGKVMREGVKVWGLGTWPLKSEHYTNLHKVRACRMRCLSRWLLPSWRLAR